MVSFKRQDDSNVARSVSSGLTGVSHDFGERFRDKVPQFGQFLRQVLAEVRREARQRERRASSLYSEQLSSLNE